MTTSARWWLSLWLIAVSAHAELPPLVVDGDADGISDEMDDCLYTPPGIRVNEQGCPLLAEDGDVDGVADPQDDCPYTPPGARVDSHGCALDADIDGVADGVDRCPTTILGVSVDAFGCTAAQARSPLAPIPALALSPAPAPAPAPQPDPQPGPPALAASAAVPVATPPAKPASPPAEPTVPSQSPAAGMPALAVMPSGKGLPPLQGEVASPPSELAPPVVSAASPEAVVAPQASGPISAGQTALPPPATEATSAPPAPDALATVIAETVQFAIGSSLLDSTAKTQLNAVSPRVTAALKRDPQLRLDLLASADTREGQDGSKLVIARSEAVRQALIARGVPRELVRVGIRVHNTGAPVDHRQVQLRTVDVGGP